VAEVARLDQSNPPAAKTGNGSVGVRSDPPRALCGRCRMPIKIAWNELYATYGWCAHVSINVIFAQADFSVCAKQGGGSTVYICSLGPAALAFLKQSSDQPENEIGAS
jgi:hypothetical protein